MKKILLLIILAAATILGATKNSLYIYVNSSPDKIELKWFLKNYSSDYKFKIFRAKKGEKLKLIATIKPASVNYLKRVGYSNDYIFMIYPLKNIRKNSDLIKTLKIMPKVSAFRAIRAMQENSFAKNLGHYFIDKMVHKNSIYLYKIDAYKGGKKELSSMVVATTKPFIKGRDIMWVRAKSIDNGIALSWDTQDDFAFYNIYRKKKGEKRFKKINNIPVYIEKNFTKKAKYLYVDKDIKKNIFATYYITKIDMFSQEGKPSSKVSIRYKKHVPIHRVSTLFATTKKNGVVLRWRKVGNSLGYNIYKSSVYTGGYKKINKKPVKTNHFFDKNYTPAKASYYFVTALNLKAESLPSNIVMAFSRDIEPPKRVEGLKAKVKPGKVILKWSKNKEKDLLGYKIYISMDMDNKEWSLVNKKPVKKNYFIHKRAKTLSRFPYYYRVSAVDTHLNESIPSKIVKVKLPDIIAPPQPVFKGYKNYTNKVTLNWAQVITYDFSHYNIYKKVGRKWKKLNQRPLLNNYFEDKKAKIGKNIYAITSVDNNKNESKIKKTVSIVIADRKPPTIKNFKVKKVKKGVLISFNCKDRDYYGFEVYRSSSSILNYFNISNFIKRKKSFLDKNIAKKAHYFYRVIAYDKNGNIAKSKVIDIKLK